MNCILWYLDYRSGICSGFSSVTSQCIWSIISSPLSCSNTKSTLSPGLGRRTDKNGLVWWREAVCWSSLTMWFQLLSSFISTSTWMISRLGTPSQSKISQHLGNSCVPSFSWCCVRIWLSTFSIDWPTTDCSTRTSTSITTTTRPLCRSQVSTSTRWTFS